MTTIVVLTKCFEPDGSWTIQPMKLDFLNEYCTPELIAEIEQNNAELRKEAGQ
jgi:hypothetical protein